VQITGMSALDLSRAIRARAVSCVEVMGATLDAIAARNGAANAIVALRPEDELLAEAARADAALSRDAAAGWMHGMPHAVKDTTAAAGLAFTQGSPVFADRIAEEDAPHVARMRAAGAILIGKTNVPEFGLGSHTYNTVFGATRNPYDPGADGGRIERRRGGCARAPDAAGGRRQRPRRARCATRPRSTTSSGCGPGSAASSTRSRRRSTRA
jgi:amidase